MMCGELWPDSPAFDGRPVTCHLDKGHGGFWHRWDHENHVGPNDDFADGMIAWHTPFARMMAVPAIHKVVEVGGPISHEVVVHPTHQMIRANLPPKPVRR